ncbi:MAG TPA: hypothetical protein VJN18_35875 [Polyangiaceae bacterium]|nr:hypothetical protein [Polyangiaceae bacterium]
MADPAQDFSQAQAYDAEGKPVAPDQVGAAVSSGKAFFQQGAKVYARNPRGELVTVAPEDAARPGYQVLTQAELAQAQAQKQYGEGVGNVAKATAAGAARGLTLGASDAVLTGIGGDDTRRALKGLREANPIASTAGEVAGVVAPTLLTGGAAGGAAGAGALARAGGAAAGAVRTAGVGHRAIAGVGSLVERGVERGLAGLGYEGTGLAARVGAGALKVGTRGAAEGALYGAAKAANDAVLNGDEITAEKIVAGMGHGALFGAGVGGALGAAGPLLSGAASKLVPKKEALTKLAQEQALKSVARGTDIRRLAGRAVGDAAEARLAATADDLLNYKYQSGPLKGERVFLPGRNTEELLERISTAKNEIGAALGGVKKELSAAMEAAGDSPKVGDFLRRVKEEITDPLLKSNVPGVRSQARAVDRQLADLRAQWEAHEIARAAADAGELLPVRLADGTTAMRPRQAPPAPTFEQLDAMRADLRSVFQPKAPPGGGLPPPAPKGAEQLEKTERLLSEFLKDHASQTLTKMGENPNAYNELNRRFHSFRQLEQIAGKNANQQLGNRMISPSDHALGIASGLGSLATGNVGALGAMGMGAAASVANKMLRERGNSVVADMARRAAQMDDGIDRVAQALAGRGEKAKAPALAAAMQGESLRESYERASSRVRELATPQAAMSHISALIPEVTAQYPHVGMSVSSKLLAIYQALQAKLPQSHVDTGTTLTPLAIKERVSPVQMRSFMSSVRGAFEPEKVIADLADGNVDREAVEMLKVAHPKVFQQLRSKVADYVEQNETELPYRRRVMLSMTFDFTGDSSLEPARMQGLQQTAAALTEADKIQEANMVKPQQGNPGVSKLGKTMALPSQAAFSGDM